MRFGERIVVYIFRPIYRTFFERLLWWFLAKVKVFFLAEISAQVSESLAKTADIERRLAAIEEMAAGLRGADAKNAAQWDALEQLLLALFREPESRTWDTDREVGTPAHSAIATAAGLDRVHEANNIR